MLETANNRITPSAARIGGKVRALRQGLGETQEIFGRRIGLVPSKVSELENSGRASSAVALAIESLSDFTIDAAELSETIARARSGFVRFGQYDPRAAAAPQ